MSGRDNIATVLHDCCNYWSSPPLSEEGLREIIEQHGLTPHNAINYLNSDYKFFLAACTNKQVTEGIIRYLLEYFPDAASATDDDGESPLHRACSNPNVTPGIIKLLINAAPDSVRIVSNRLWTPLHCLCANVELDEADAMQILKLLIEQHPEALRHVNQFGQLPIHRAAVEGKSTEFCRVLIDAYPGSERMTDGRGALPFHLACIGGSLKTVEYLYSLHPDAIGMTDDNDDDSENEGSYPIHYAIEGSAHMESDPYNAVELVQFLLDCDPNVKIQKTRRGRSLLHFACRRCKEHHDFLEAGFQVMKLLYDAHPEAIGDATLVSGIQHYDQLVQTFINGELVYTRQAKDQHFMTTPDSNGRLPLHIALQNNITLGSIKVLVKGNPHAVQTPDNSGSLPLHAACQHGDYTDVIDYLIELDTTTLDAVDTEGNTALHLACRGPLYFYFMVEIIELLLEKYGAVSVSKRNLQNKLPIELLWENNSVEEHREGVEYMGIVFRLLKGYPETLRNVRQRCNQAALPKSDNLIILSDGRR